MKHLFGRYSKYKNTASRASYRLKRVFFIEFSAIIFLIAISVFCQSARADDRAILAQLDAIQTLSDKNNDEGLRQLIEFRKNLPSDASSRIRLDTLSVLSGLYFDAGNNKLGEAAVDELKLLARQLKDHDTLLLIEIFDGYSVLEKSGFDAAILYLEKLLLKVSKTTSVNVRYRYSLTFATIYSGAAKFDLALKNYLDMLKLCDQLPRRQLQAKMATLNRISSLYLSMKDPVKALESATDALAVPDARLSPKAFVDISISRALALSALQRNDEALAELEKTLKIAKHENLPYGVEAALANMADQYLIKKEYKKAEQYAKDAGEKAALLESKSGVALSKINRGFALGGQGKVKQGAELVIEGTEYYKNNNQKLDIEEIYGELSYMYERAGWLKEALEYVRAQKKISDETFQSDRSKAVAMLQEQYESEQRKKQIELLAKDNSLKDADIKNHRLQQVVAILASLVAVFVGGFVYMLYRRSKKLNEQLQEVNSQLEFHAIRDALTGLHNRRAFIGLMSNRVIRVENERREGADANPDCMILLDIDHFKNINDTWGHSAGDVVLKEVASRLRNVVRDNDMLMRWGGEEFLIYSPKSNPEQITSLVERVLRTMSDTPFYHGEQAITVTVTAGFISVPFSDISEDICDWERALQIADMALYLGKTHGRNRAYGLARLLVPHEEAISILTHDLAAAIQKNMVEIIEVLGAPNNPEKEKKVEQAG
jgi:diguanylate cyclase (GGDEF)-like protein